MFQNGLPLPRGFVNQTRPSARTIASSDPARDPPRVIPTPKASPPPFEWSLSVWETAVTQRLPRGMAVHQCRLGCWTAPQPAWKILS